MDATPMSHSPETPWHGNGQGAGDSCPKWLFISSDLFDIYERKCTGQVSLNVDGTPSQRIAATGYVDDVNSRTTGRFCTDAELLMASQRDAQIWHDLLWSSGGRLELKKSHYQIIKHSIDGIGKPTLREGTDWTPPLVIATPDGGTTEIRAADALTDNRSLGCHKGPSGTLRSQLQVIKDRCLYYARLARNANLSRQEMNMFYRSMFLSSAGFSLPTTYFTECQLDSVQSPALQAMFPGMGYNRFTARAVVFVPSSLGGIDLQRLYDRQGCGLITMFVKHWRDSGPVGTFLHHLVQWAQYIAGTLRPIMEDTEDLPHIPAHIIQATRKYMRTVHVTMEVDHVDILPPQRHGNFHLMDYAVQSRVVKAAALRRINYC